ncbi:glycosyl hydrolase family 28-related protein [Pseudomonas sp. Marseille-Q5115]|uniref:glycosyl hydrolase family 28-related protein n=1 Tax=Pseudomonas sp. Marseille-Q5115 TaxID=2866593 RepID=UPI001CE3D597|nr:glycosyl hydrolase family 28-related protein [Pseudomonas sp. Marseille-Q5115]
MSIVFNVLDYGAKGDGVTDDTHAIQLAINAAYKAGGGQVLLPEGTYIVSGPNADGGCLTLKSNVALAGDGAGATTLKLADGSDAIDGIVRTSASHNTLDAGVSDLTIDGNQAATTGVVNGLVTGSATNPDAHTQDFLVSGVELADCSGSGLVANTLTDGLTVNDSVAHDNGEDGFATRFATRAGRSDSVRFSDNEAYANGDDGFDLHMASSGTTYAGVQLNSNSHDNGDAGIVLTGYAQPAKNFQYGEDTLGGGTVYGNGGVGVKLENMQRATITRVDIHDNGDEGLFLAGTQNIHIDHNAIHQNLVNGPGSEILIEGLPAGEDGTPAVAADIDFDLTDNAITAGVNSTYGITAPVLHGSVLHYVSGNTLLGFQGQGARPNDDPTYWVELRLYGTDANDRLNSAFSDYLNGGAGRDTLTALNYRSLLIGGADVDKLIAGTGFETFAFEKVSDSYMDAASAAHRDVITGFDVDRDVLDLSAIKFRGVGDGHDGTLSLRYYSTSDTTVLESLDADADGNRFAVALTGDYRDKLTARNFVDFYEGTNGDDDIYQADDTSENEFKGHVYFGNEGNDSIWAVAGDFVVYGGAGADVLGAFWQPGIFMYTAITDSYINDAKGERVLDTLSYNEGVIDVSALGFTGIGDGHNGTLIGDYDEVLDSNVYQSLDADANGNRFAIVGAYDQDFLFAPSPYPGVEVGLIGSSTLIPYTIDTLDDVMDGGQGNDILIGLAGKDKLTGGSGADTFRYLSVNDSFRSGADLITDFSFARDTLDVSALGFTGLGDGSGTTVRVAYSAATDRTYIKNQEPDADGHSFEVGLAGNLADQITAGNFVFAVADGVELTTLGVASTDPGVHA